MRLIDADELIQAVGKLMPKKMPFDYDEDDNDLGAILCDVKEIIDDQPTVNEWIPCSERLPEDGENVLGLMKINAHDIVFYNDKYHCWLSACDDYTYEKDSIIAWMPIPEPLKEDE